MTLTKLQKRQVRKKRIRARLSGTAARPRLTVYRSLACIYAQLIDDSTGKTLVAASTKEAKAKPSVAGGTKLGALVSKKAKEAGISSVVFDRNGYSYHGIVKAIAEAAREGGLQF